MENQRNQIARRETNPQSGLPPASGQRAWGIEGRLCESGPFAGPSSAGCEAAHVPTDGGCQSARLINNQTEKSAKKSKSPRDSWSFTPKIIKKPEQAHR